MSVISNLKIDNNIITFDVFNTPEFPVKIGLANALRRTIIANLETYSINKNSVNFYDSYKETDILQNEFLIDRLALIPIVSNLKDFDYDNLVISCKKENNDDNIMSVYVSDFFCKNILTDETIDINTICKYPNILFSKIINGGKISFDCKLMKSTSEKSGAGNSPVSACAYQFKQDDAKIQELIADMDEHTKQVFMTQENQRYYEKNELGEPTVYQFYYESIGNYECIEILQMGIQILIDKYTFVKNDFQNIEYVIDKNDFYIFTIQNVNETLGVPLQKYLSLNPKVFYAGYVIEHPLKNELSLKIKLNDNKLNDNKLNEIYKVIDETFELFIQILNQCLNDIKKY